ncbi:MAG: DUF4382 domain-containing protein [Gammaproteobacteria bacterium]|nr:DUF4382 domain-containing protein [Gammaproteobacteria bacterium]
MKRLVCLIGIVALFACGGGGSDSGGVDSVGGGGDIGGSGGQPTGQLSIAITDAPVDYATEVVVTIDAVELKPMDGEAILIEFEARQIDLLVLQDGASTVILNRETVPAGEYNWIRLQLHGDPGTVDDSYVMFDDGSLHPLVIPSFDETGLKLVSGFVVPANGHGSYTLDVDIRAALHAPPGQNSDFFLRPALRIVDNTLVGEIAGTVSTDLIDDDAGCTSGNAVYVYEGDVIPDDVDMADSDDTEPVTSTIVKLNETTGDYEYVAAFLHAGDYTVAFTCQAGDDDPDLDDDIIFTAIDSATVVAGETTVVNL